MSSVLTIFKNDQNARSPTLVKSVTTTDILIGQVHTFQNIYFKEHMWKDATVLQKAYLFKRMLWDVLMKESSWKRFHWNSPKR